MANPKVTNFVFCMVWIEYLCPTQYSVSKVHGRDMPQKVNRRSLTVQARFQSQANRANFGGRSGSRKGLYPSALVVACQCLSTSALVVACQCLSTSALAVACQCLSTSALVVACQCLSTSALVVACQCLSTSALVVACQYLSTSALVVACQCLSTSALVVACQCLSTSALVAACQCLSTSVPYSSLSTRCSYQNCKMSEAWETSKNNCSYGKMSSLDNKVTFSYF